VRVAPLRFRRALAEALGTFFLVLIGPGTATVNAYTAPFAPAREAMLVTSSSSADLARPHGSHADADLHSTA
jgi:glycerol uptake facilitator-like aquaporin